MATGNLDGVSMWIATLVRRWLAGKPAAEPGTATGALPRRSRSAVPPAPALRWRAPWLPWQLASWLLTTLLAPPFWCVGTLLLINPASDQPFFWAAAMAIVPVANGVAMIAANQRHHRAPFAVHRAAAAYLFSIGGLVAGTLFAMLLWASHSTSNLVDLLSAAPDGVRTAGEMSWVAALIGGFGLASALPACIVHALLAFDE
ncbi:hypothetical protein [Burkholderia sp. 3C]